MSDHRSELLLAVADDLLMLGHRNSDWTGLGPILEEDIAFSALAQADIAHAQALYEHAGTLMGRDANQLAFGRPSEEYRCASIVEVPDDFNWAVALARQSYCAHFDAVRLTRLRASNDTKLAALCGRLADEQVMHVDHTRVWIRHLGADADARSRLQDAFDLLAPHAAVLGESIEGEADLVSSGFYPAIADDHHAAWLEPLVEYAAHAGFTINVPPPPDGYVGGRRGQHTEYLPALLDEMCEVFRLAPDAAW